MPFLELVNRRESTRAFSTAPVEREKILRCLEAARLAPSACNGQPWRFIVVDSHPLKENLVQEAFSGIYRMNAFAIEAPVIVVVATTQTRSPALLGGLFRRFSYPLVDIGIACEHFVLQATEEGLATCWLGWFDEKAVNKLIPTARWERVHILLAIGYPKGPGRGAKRRKTLEEISEFR